MFPKTSDASSYVTMKAQALDLLLQSERANDKAGIEKYQNRLDRILAQEEQEAKTTVAAGEEYKPHTQSTVTSLYNATKGTAANILEKQAGEFGIISDDLMGNPMVAPMQEYLTTHLMKASAVVQDKTLIDYASGRQKVSIDLIGNAARSKTDELLRNEIAMQKIQSNGKTGVKGVRYLKTPATDSQGKSIDLSKRDPVKAINPQQVSGLGYGETIIMQDELGNTRILVHIGVPNPKENGAPFLVIQ